MVVIVLLLVAVLSFAFLAFLLGPFFLGMVLEAHDEKKARAKARRAEPPRHA